jgi:hypothetical protein
MSTRGDGVVETQQLFQVEDGGSIPTSPLQLTFDTCSVHLACALNAKWHSRFPIIEWSNVVRNKDYVCFVAKFDGTFLATAIWSSPIAANRLKCGNQMLELRRMAIANECPPNTASRMLGYMRRWIKKEMPHIATLISYQDTEAHAGTIYKASGWSIGGSSNLRWDSGNRKRNAPQSTASKVRWESKLREPIKPSEEDRIQQDALPFGIVDRKTDE